jgi:DNA-binding NtrC family response regulator
VRGGTEVQAEETRAPEDSRRRHIVFFVDDEAGIRRIADRLLRKRGFDMISASSAAEAERVIESYEGHIDVLLMDINLPDGWGAMVAQRLKSTHSEMAVVYTTGFAEIDPILSGGLSGSDFVIRKPFTGDQLADVLNRAIEAKGSAH